MAQTKRLVLCCDGTWNDSVSTNNPLTNVARFSRIVEERAADGVLQIVYYHTGVGAGTSRISNSIDGAVGRGELTCTPPLPASNARRAGSKRTQRIQLSLPELQPQRSQR
jgi:hypothetical protein